MADTDPYYDDTSHILRGAAVIFTQRNDPNLLANVAFLSGYLDGFRRSLQKQHDLQATS